MKTETIRTSVDIPVSLHQRLHAAAARRGCSARQMILQGIEHVVDERTPRPKRRIQFPLLNATAKPIRLTNEQIYELIEFP